MYGRRYYPRTQARQSFAAAAFARRSGLIKATQLARFRALTANRRRPIGLPATRGFRPLGLRGTGERKVIDIPVGSVDVNTTGSFTLLNGCEQGSDYTDRIGRKIFMKSLFIRGMVSTQPSLAPTAPQSAPSQTARMVILIDSQPNGSTPIVTDLLNTASPFSQLNLNNRDRFRILADETFVFGPLASSNTATQSWAYADQQAALVERYIKLRHETIFNSGNAGTIGDITTGSILMFVAQDTGITVANPTLNFRARIRYTDI